MKRRFPGNGSGPPPGGRHFDGRRPPFRPGRGGPHGGPPPMMGRGGAPGGFPGRGGHPGRPPINFHEGRGRAPPPPPNMGRGPVYGRGNINMPPSHGRGPPPGRGMRGSSGNFGGSVPGMMPPMGRGIPPPPPPPRMVPGPMMNTPFHNRPPPPPIHPPGGFPHGPPPAIGNHRHLPPPPGPYHSPLHIPSAPPRVIAAYAPPAAPLQVPPVASASAGVSMANFSSVAAHTAVAHAASPASQPAPPVGTQVARAAVPTQQQIDAAWTEHTAPDGKTKYYHNPYLKESTYIKPDALKKKDGSTTDSTKKQWQEYTDPSSGKKYYSDGVSTTWEKPVGFSSLDHKVTDSDNMEEAQPKRKKKRVPQEIYTSKEEAIAAFKGFLLAKAIQPNSKWNEVSKLLSSNARWDAFTETLSVGERRQALAEYQTKRANDLKNQERQERLRAKEAFTQLLTDVLQNTNGFSASSSRFSDIRATLAKDDRFHAVSDEKMRESLFLDFCEELRKREERKKRNKKREIQHNFQSFLKEKEDIGILTFATTWDLFLSKLADEDLEDSRFKASPSLSEGDRQLFFADFVIQLQVAEDDKRRRIQDARYRAEKAQRDAYRDVLRRLAVGGKIRPYTRWRAVEDLVANDDASKAVTGQSPDAPIDLFEEFVDEWDDHYHRERSLLSELIDCQPLEAQPMVQLETPFEDFKKWLLDRAEISPSLFSEVKRVINREDPVSTARVYWEELVSKAKHATNRGSQVNHPDESSSEDEGEIIEEDVESPNDDKQEKSMQDKAGV